MKPLGYYTPHTPGDGTLLDQLEQEYGSYFERMNSADKYYFIYDLALNLSGHLGGMTPEIMRSLLAARSLDNSTKASLIKFLIDNAQPSEADINSQPDPAWEYSEIWQSLHNIKTKIDAALATIAGEEQASEETDKKLKNAVESVLQELEKVDDDLDAALVLYFE